LVKKKKKKKKEAAPPKPRQSPFLGAKPNLKPEGYGGIPVLQHSLSKKKKGGAHPKKSRLQSGGVAWVKKKAGKIEPHHQVPIARTSARIQLFSELCGKEKKKTGRECLAEVRRVNVGKINRANAHQSTKTSPLFQSLLDGSRSEKKNRRKRDREKNQLRGINKKKT